MLFGRGLVKTTDDFGTQGALPTHPELLDHLAVTFQENHWDLKWLLKQIMMSNVYQQSSQRDRESAKIDSDNALLSSGPRHRLDSRLLRDQALHLSGLLVRKVGGPSVMPYQPEGVWEEMSFGKNRYFQGTGEDLYRQVCTHSGDEASHQHHSSTYPPDKHVMSSY